MLDVHLKSVPSLCMKDLRRSRMTSQRLLDLKKATVRRTKRKAILKWSRTLNLLSMMHRWSRPSILRSSGVGGQLELWNSVQVCQSILPQVALTIMVFLRRHSQDNNTSCQQTLIDMAYGFLLLLPRERGRACCPRSHSTSRYRVWYRLGFRSFRYARYGWLHNPPNFDSDQMSVLSESSSLVRALISRRNGHSHIWSPRWQTISCKVRSSMLMTSSCWLSSHSDYDYWFIRSYCCRLTDGLGTLPMCWHVNQRSSEPFSGSHFDLVVKLD